MRTLLASPFCKDLDFVNSLPVVASQLDRLGLCSASSLAALRDYCANRGGWFDAIATHHSIPPVTTSGMSRRAAAKALPIRLIHCGGYARWAKDAEVPDAGLVGDSVAFLPAGR